MRYLPTSICLLLLAIPCGTAGEPKADKIVLDFWDAAYLKGNKAGYVHTFTTEFEENGQKLLRTTVEMRLTVKRNDDVKQMSMDSGTVETPQGRVVRIFVKQYLAKDKSLEISGTVIDNQLKLMLDQTKLLKTSAWNDRVIGLYRQQRICKDQKVKAGDEFSYLSYEPAITAIVPIRLSVKDYEVVELFAGQEKKKLLRVETKPDKIDNVQLPTLISWLNDKREVERSQVEAPGLGLMVLYRATKAVATAPGNLDALTDIGLSQAVPLKQAILKPYATTAAVYRITIRNEDDPGSAFSNDDRQKVKNVRGTTLELHVRAGGPVGADTSNGKMPGAEFTQSSYFINSDDPLVRKHARSAVKEEKDPWKKALRVEKWVYDNMKGTNFEALATADHVAKTLEGDCTEFAMLMAAMCRAEGVPSRTAVGLIYGEAKERPVFAFHMWTEVFVRGRWVPLDATLGQGRVGATHLKISDQSWHETRTLTPLFPVLRVLGRISIDVVSVENVLKP